MNPATGVVLTGAVVALGQWSKDEPVSIRIVVGGTVLALGLSVLAESEPEIAGKFTALIVIAATFTYVPAIAWKIGLLDHAKYPKPPSWV